VALIGGGVAATIILLLVITATVLVIILICGKTRKNQKPIREDPYYTAVNTAGSGINVPLGAGGAISAVGSCASSKGSHTYAPTPHHDSHPNPCPRLGLGLGCSIDPSMMFANEANSKGETVVCFDTVRTNADDSDAESNKSVMASMVENKADKSNVDKQDANKSDCDDGGEEKAENDTP
jgi:hypothetical protein